MGVMSKVLALPVHIATSLYAILATLLPFLPQLARRHALLSDGSAAGYERAVARYERLYTPEHPAFYRGSYKQLVDDVKAKLELALVYLHSDDHDDTLRFARESLAAPDLAALLAEFKVNLYFGPMDQPEPFEIAAHLGATAFPFLALITLQSVNGVVKPTVVFRSEGWVAPDTLVAKLRDAIQTHGLFLATVRHQREQQDADRRMRAMQDEAYQASLQRDMERQREQERAAEATRAAEAAKSARRTELAQELRDRKSRRAAARASLPAEPDTATAGRTVLQFRLPNGSRVRRAFRDADPVRALYEYVSTLDPLGEDDLDADEWAEAKIKAEEAGASSSEEEDEEESVVQPFGFLLVDVFPRREFRDVDATLAGAGLRGGNLVVEV
ncbi:UBX domain-containing protein 10 [Blastocladiella emersonii ATCC 22665]|nr:UBX domain-containing protein 10 [Blastocladiella emersonii ATCC 22665]